eukprot:SAG11_NODE_827_length_6974_cov_4.300945_4_plen_423_part_00
MFGDAVFLALCFVSSVHSAEDLGPDDDLHHSGWKVPGPTVHPDGRPRGDMMLRRDFLLNQDGTPRRDFYGRGCAVLDVDADGYDDVWLSNADNADSRALWGDDSSASQLFLAVPDAFDETETTPSQARSAAREPGQFYRRVPAQAIKRANGAKKPAKGGWEQLGIPPSHSQSQWGMVFFDLDNDGDQDLLLCNGGYEGPQALRLYRNNAEMGQSVGAMFTDITALAGVDGPDFFQFWWGGSAADYDNDGLIDLVVTHINAKVNYDLYIEGRNGEPHPEFKKERQSIFLLHNLGGGHFAEEALLCGLQLGNPKIKPTYGISETKNPVWLDFDGDGDQDLYVAGSPHSLFRNDGVDLATLAFTGFTDVTRANLHLPHYANKLVFSAAAADFDQDGARPNIIFTSHWERTGVATQSDRARICRTR